MTVLLEKPYKKKCANSFVSIIEWMILDNEVEKMSGLFLNSGIEIIRVKSRNNTRENSFKTDIFLITEELCCLSLLYESRLELMDHFSSLGVLYNIGNIGIPIDLETTSIELIEEDEALGIIRDNLQESLGLCNREFSLGLL
jgi:hypothetical protein